MNQSEEFLEQLSSSQGRLFAYLFAALGDADRANEVLQETNLVLWRKSGEYVMGSSFSAWSYRIANFQLMSHRQRQLREKLFFDQDLVEQIAQRSKNRSDLYSTKLQQLDRCIGKMPSRYRDVITRRYHSGESLQQIAEEMKQTPNAVGQLIFRMKKRLIDCVTQGLVEVMSDAT